MTTKLEPSYACSAHTALLVAALLATGAAVAQPVDPSASAPAASASPAGRAAPVRRPPAVRPPPPLGADPANQPGLGQPVTPQLRIPFGRKPLPATAASSPPPPGRAASSRD